MGATITNATEKPTLNRENDSFLMDHFINANLTTKDLAKLNRVRLHLQIARISEIATADGKYIHKSWLTETGQRNSLSLLNWPRQEINPSLWKHWLKHIKRTFLNEQGMLKTKLGAWTSYPKERVYLNVYDPSDETIYTHIPDTTLWTTNSISDKQRRSWTLQPTGSTECPQQAYMFPIDILPNRDNQQLQCYPVNIKMDKTTPTHDGSFISCLLHENTTTKALVHDVTILIPEEQIHALLLHHKKVTIASDGGVTDGTGSFGWILAINDTVIAKARGPAEGSKDLMHSFRAEGYGMLSATTFISELDAFFSLPATIKWEFLLDSESLMKRLDTHKQPILPMNFPLATDYDVTQAVHCQLAYIDHTITHVKSHQDDNSPFEKLSKAAQYNVMADRLATTQYESMTGPEEHISLNNVAYLKIGKQFITRKPAKALREAARYKTQVPFLCKKFNWTKAAFNNIDWDVSHTAFKTFTRADRTRLIKFIHGWLPTGKRRHRETKGMYPQSCALCHAMTETNHHMLHCNHTEQVNHMENLSLDLEKLRQEMKSDRELNELVKSSIFQSAHDEDYQPNPKYVHQSVHHIITKQGSIGWNQITQGRLSKSIVQHQDNYYKAKGIYDDKHFTGKRWAVKLLITIWKTVLKTWKTRCEIVHGRDRQEQQANATRIYKHRVQACYNFLPQLQGTDRHMFDSTATETLSKPPQQIETWLTMVEMLIKQVQKEHREPKNQRPISDYFKVPSHNLRVRQLNEKSTRNQDIRQFLKKNTTTTTHRSTPK